MYKKLKNYLKYVLNLRLQIVPCQSASHTHSNFPKPGFSVQMAPFKHGFGLQLLTSKTQFLKNALIQLKNTKKQSKMT